MPLILNQSTGRFLGQAIYNVPAQAKGVLIQQTTMGNAVPYYEAWLVADGVVLDPGNTLGTSWIIGDINDVFPFPVVNTISGQIQFYPNTSLSDFPDLQPRQAGGYVPYAADLPASWIAPPGWTSDGAVPHSITVTGSPGSYSMSTCHPNC